MIPYTNLQYQYQEIKQDIDTAIFGCLKRNSYVGGTDTEIFENQIAEYTGAEGCCSTSSGTAALHLAMLSLGIGVGDEVITVSHGFIASTAAIVHVGAVPVFVDIDSDYLIDIEKITEAINKNTRAILFVDMCGQSPDIDSIIKIAKEYNLYTIEDAAHSFGAEYKNKKIGNSCDLVCFSFNPVKNLGSLGDAGALVGKEKYISIAKKYREHGRETKFTQSFFGFNYRIDNIQASVLLAKLPYLDDQIQKTNLICDRYSNELKNFIKTPKIKDHNVHSFHVYNIEVDNRDNLKEHLSNKGIATNIHYPIPIHLQKACKKFNTTNLPNTERVTQRILSLPKYTSLSEQDQDKIIYEIINWKKNQ